MSQEADRVEGPYVVHDFTVDSSTAVPMGTLMSGAAVRGATPSAGVADETFVGIAGTEKSATDGSTELGLVRSGIWDVWATSGAAITVNELVKLSGANYVTGAVDEADIIAGQVVGQALEATSAGVWEQIEVDIGRT